MSFRSGTDGTAVGLRLRNDLAQAVAGPGRSNPAPASHTGADAYGQDAFGYGWFPGQYGMLVLSKYPIDTRAVRTFQHFLWKDMPGHVMPPGHYSDEARARAPVSTTTRGAEVVCGRGRGS